MNPVAAARTAAEHDYRRFDWHRERNHLWAEVQRLTKVGVSASTVAMMCGIQERSVVRIRGRDLEPPAQHLTFDVSDKRAQLLESMADTMLALACSLRDEDPTKVWDTLSKLDRRVLQELTVIALSAVNPDSTKSELWGWLS